MTQGRKPKTALALGSALALVAGFAIVVPAFAAAQAAADGHQLEDIPNPDEPAQQAAPESSRDTESSAVPPASAGTTGSASGRTATAPVTDNGGANRQGDAGKSDNDAEIQVTPVVAVEPSDGGSAPVLLIALASIAAICTGLAVWRLRRTDGETRM